MDCPESGKIPDIRLWLMGGLRKGNGGNDRRLRAYDAEYRRHDQAGNRIPYSRRYAAKRLRERSGLCRQRLGLSEYPLSGNLFLYECRQRTLRENSNVLGLSSRGGICGQRKHPHKSVYAFKSGMAGIEAELIPTHPSLY